MRSTIVRALEAERRDGESAEDVLERLVMRGHNVGKLVAWANTPSQKHPTWRPVVNRSLTLSFEDRTSRLSLQDYETNARLGLGLGRDRRSDDEVDRMLLEAVRKIEKGEI